MHRTNTCRQDVTSRHTTGSNPLARLWFRLLCWQDLANQRRELRNLDARSLRDIGIGRDDALRESRRPFWDGPKH
ncbi:MAG: DUF1127 domain-containing protein [Alphaproteobacteria bacterium]|jgi:uncharacterized protein YjiS (DUF1127 family)